MGTVYSRIIVRYPVPGDVYGCEVPYVVALVELAEGVRMASNIIDCDPDTMTADMAVEVVFEAVTETVTLPNFAPSNPAGSGLLPAGEGSSHPALGS